MADDFNPSARLAGPGEYDPDSREFAELRELLLGGERRQLDELRRRLDAMGLTTEELAEVLPEAIALRSGRDRQLARALAPTVENAISESVRRNPRELATAIFPVLGPAIRKAIAETLAGLVESINRAIEHSFSPRGIRWRLEAWRTGVPFAQIVLRHALVYRVEQIFLIHAETGLLLAHAASPDLKVTDADLISGMLTAIQDFVGDSFAPTEAGGALRTFSVGEVTVMVERGPEAALAAVVRGQPPESLLPRLQDTLETVHLQFAQAFAEYNGDAAPFAPARPQLEECLETVLNTDRGQPGAARGGMIWLRWALPALVILAAVGWLFWRARHRFSLAVDRLSHEPGLVVVQAERSGGRWHFRGLRDPVAGDPRLILAGMGADTLRIDGRWEPYFSLDPALMVERARRQLAVPARVSLALRGDSLIATGTAPMAWLAKSRSAAPQPGISGLDLSAVVVELPAELAQLARDISGSRILFSPGSAVVGPGANDSLRTFAELFRRLASGLAALGYRPALELIGRADTTGSEATNRALSRERVDAVRARLAGLGLPEEGINATGVGTSQPLPSPLESERARINRSVTFVVHLQPAAARPDSPQ